MHELIHPATGLSMGDPYASPLEKKPTAQAAADFFGSLILSASGWRGVFGRSDDDLSEELSPEAAYAGARMASVFADWLLARYEPARAEPARAELARSGQPPAVALGVDTRPTGPAIAHCMARVFLAKGIAVRYAFVCAAPEIMAWARHAGKLEAGHPERLDAFCYISASHNPPGHNGVKFGLTDGGVLSGPEAAILITALKDGAAAPEDIDLMQELCAATSGKAMGALFSDSGRHKRLAMSAYALFAREVAGGSERLDEQESALDALAQAVGQAGCGIVADMNGSARSVSIDYNFLTGLGVTLRAINDRPRGFAHRIVPEGASLEPCRRELEAARAEDGRYRLGYVPDCDGDRGNLVVMDGNVARPLKAQETYALALLAELSDLARRSGPETRLAAVGNDATSLRAEAICKALGASFFRAETGEANVVGLARKLRAQGWAVRVLGEGSNGGVITWPAAVRDPINTIAAVLKLMYLRDEGNTPGPWKYWLERSGQAGFYKENFELSDILSSLPPWTSTSVFEERAALRVRTRDHAALKDAYQTRFERGWPKLAAMLGERYGALSWRAMASSGTGERLLEGRFGQSGSGGLRIALADASGTVRAFLWMRGSGTEPAFRVMADLEGDEVELELRVLALHATWLLEADASCCEGV